MADYTQLGSFNTGGSAALNGTLIQKLYDAEEKTRVKPIEKSLELWDTEKLKITEINTKVNELIEAIKPFDLFTASNTAFDQKSASVIGDSALFDASDVNGLKPGKTTVNIIQLAQKNSFESAAFASKTDPLAGMGNIIIKSNSGSTVELVNISTDGKSYEEVATEINQNGQFDASVQKVSDTEYKLIIKSKEPGTANAFYVSQNGTAYQEVLAAQNMEAKVDGVDYDLSSNSISLDGNLKITASKVGESTLTIEKDDSAIIPAIEEVATKYNELVAMVTEELYSDESSSQNKSALKTIINDIKNMMYEKFGAEVPIFGTQTDSDGDQLLEHSNVTNNEISLFNLGFSFNKEGLLSIDTKILGEAVSSNLEEVKRVFIGAAENHGFGTLLKEHLDSLNSYDGLFKSYETNMDRRKTSLEKDKEQTIKNLDTKYDTMAEQFAAYGAIITRMESSFSGLKAIIASENSSK